MAFMFNPPLIILDEPTVGFDPATNVHFKDLVLRRAESGATVVLVSHILGEVEQIAREMVFLDDGKIIFSGTPGRLLQQTGAASLERAVIHLLESKKGVRSP
jgi:Cu-processing system ATP-binding protein